MTNLECSIGDLHTETHRLDWDPQGILWSAGGGLLRYRPDNAGSFLLRVWDRLDSHAGLILHRQKPLVAIGALKIVAWRHGLVGDVIVSQFFIHHPWIGGNSLSKFSNDADRG